MHADLKRLTEVYLADEPATLDGIRDCIVADAGERRELLAEFERRARAIDSPTKPGAGTHFSRELPNVD
jgi:hypothetical protein